MKNLMCSTGDEMLKLVERLFPICRSLTGEGNRETLRIIKEYLPELSIIEVPTGTKCFDWTVPDEWAVRDAYIIDPNGNKICDFKLNNLHLVGYSVSFSGELDLIELKKHLYSRPDLPDAIPYVTSYYNRTWGFCIAHSQLELLVDGVYKVFIDTNHFKGSMSVGEVILPGETTEEIFLSTYICHPSMANNELSGPVVAISLMQYFASLNKKQKYTIRAIFIPETIGSIYYLSRHHLYLKKNLIAGFNLSCVGDDRAYSFLPTKYNNTVVDRVGAHVIKHFTKEAITYGWNDRGSDERQYCSPNIDLPVISLMRSKHTEYDEYHTSLDNVDSVVTASGLKGGFDVNLAAIQAMIKNFRPKSRHPCEPMMRKYNLYPEFTHGKRRPPRTRLYMNILTWSDGTNDLIDIADRLETPVWELYEPVDDLIKAGLLV